MLLNKMLSFRPLCHAGRHFDGIENVILAGFGLVGNTEKKIFCPIMNNFQEWFFHVHNTIFLKILQKPSNSV
jgi:hypothetical protein